MNLLNNLFQTTVPLMICADSNFWNSDEILASIHYWLCKEYVFVSSPYKHEVEYHIIVFLLCVVFFQYCYAWSPSHDQFDPKKNHWQLIQNKISCSKIYNDTPIRNDWFGSIIIVCFTLMNYIKKILLLFLFRKRKFMHAFKDLCQKFLICGLLATMWQALYLHSTHK